MQYELTDNNYRKQYLKDVHRVVIKIGTRLLMDMKGVTPRERIQELIQQVAMLRAKGIKVVLVSSGAIGAGMLVTNAQRRPRQVEKLQALAAVGQCHLMSLYQEACQKHDFNCAQLLLTAADLQARERHLRVSQCIEALLHDNILPVINENDSVCDDEIKVGDNDTLAAYITSLCRADLTILLTTADGFYETNPETGEFERRISVVKKIDKELFAMACGTDGNQFSTGGMRTKLHAALLNTTCGEPLIIASGFDFSILKDIFTLKDCGTLFIPAGNLRLHAIQRYLALFSAPHGDVVVDSGAEDALCNQGKSLLPIGVLGVRGSFASSDTVRILNIDSKEIGKGIVNFSSASLSKICGTPTKELEAKLGQAPAWSEVIHRKNLVLTGWNLF